MLSSEVMPTSLRVPGPNPIPPSSSGRTKSKPQEEGLQDLLGPGQAENPGSPAQKLLGFQETKCERKLEAF